VLGGVRRKPAGWGSGRGATITASATTTASKDDHGQQDGGDADQDKN
jgi:hypothetical protein